MFLDNKNKHHHFEYDQLKITWNGFIYIPGIASGQTSIQYFLAKAKEKLKKLETTSLINYLKEYLWQLEGQYFIAISLNQELLISVDPSGMYHFFYSKKAASPSFLALINSEGLKPDDLDKTAIAEFLHWGNFHDDRTFFKEINKLKGNTLLHYNSEGCKKIHKSRTNIKDLPLRSFEDSMNALAKSCQGLKLSIDITGGVDSRLLVAAMDYYDMNYDLAVSGPKDHIDVVYADKIAKTLNKKLTITTQCIENLDADLENVFDCCDGIVDITTYHRLFQHQGRRAEGKYDLSISGAGGEIYKEYVWLHDFPFYKSNKVNWERFYQLRFCPIAPEHSILHPNLQGKSNSIKANILEELKSFKHTWNTQTYDDIYLSYKWPVYYGRFITNNSSFFPCYAPFLELSRAQFTYQLKRSARFFNKFHRDLNSYYHPTLSKMPTTEGGMSLSNKRYDLSMDILKYFNNRGQRLLNKISQKTLKRSFLSFTSPNQPNYKLELRKTKLYGQGFKTLKNHGLLHPELVKDQLSDRYVGPVITLGLLINRLS